MRLCNSSLIGVVIFSISLTGGREGRKIWLKRGDLFFCLEGNEHIGCDGEGYVLAKGGEGIGLDWPLQLRGTPDYRVATRGVLLFAGLVSSCRLLQVQRPCAINDPESFYSAEQWFRNLARLLSPIYYHRHRRTQPTHYFGSFPWSTTLLWTWELNLTPMLPEPLLWLRI